MIRAVIDKSTRDVNFKVTNRGSSPIVIESLKIEQYDNWLLKLIRFPSWTHNNQEFKFPYEITPRQIWNRVYSTFSLKDYPSYTRVNEFSENKQLFIKVKFTHRSKMKKGRITVEKSDIYPQW